MKKSVLLGVVGVLVVGMMAFSFADAAFGPAKIYADLTGVTEEAAYAQRQESGDSYGVLAKEAGVYEAFAEATLASKKVMIEEMVTEGKITRAEADAVLSALEDCDGTQTHILQNSLGFGQHLMNGQGNGQKAADGTGFGAGRGRWQTGN